MKIKSLLLAALISAGSISPAFAQDTTEPGDNIPPKPSRLAVITGTTVALTKGPTWIKGDFVMKEKEDGIYEVDFTLNSTNGYYFALYNGLISETAEGYPMGPGTEDDPVELSMGLGDTETFDFLPNKNFNRGDCWLWTNPGDEANLTATVDWNNQTLTIVNNTPPYYGIILTFMDGEKKIVDGGVHRFVSVTSNGADLGVKSNPYDFWFATETATLTFEALKEVADYEVVSLDCLDYNGNLDSAPFKISGLGTPETGYENVKATLEVGKEADGLTFVVTISKDAAVESIGVENEADVKIYNLQGVKVNSDLNALPKGLYIVNGKKVVR